MEREDQRNKWMQRQKLEAMEVTQTRLDRNWPREMAMEIERSERVSEF